MLQYSNIIRHRAFRHARACLIHLSCFLMFGVLFSCSEGGPQPRGQFSPRGSRDSCSFLLPSFCMCFQTSFLTTINPKRSQNRDYKTAKKSWKTAKNHHQNAPTIKTCKKTQSGRGQTFEIDDSYTLSFVFVEAQRSQKGGKMAPTIEPQGTQNRETILKTSTRKNKQHCIK